MKDDIGAGCLAICLWTVIFIVGLFIAGEIDKVLGITIMAGSTYILLLKLNTADKLDKRQEQLDRFRDDADRRIREERERND